MRAAGCDPAGWSTRRSNDQCSMARHPRSALDNPDYQPRLGLSLEIRRSRKQLRAHRLAGLGPVSRISPGHQSRPIRSAPRGSTRGSAPARSAGYRARAAADRAAGRDRRRDPRSPRSPGRRRCVARRRDGERARLHGEGAVHPRDLMGPDQRPEVLWQTGPGPCQPVSSHGSRGFWTATGRPSAGWYIWVVPQHSWGVVPPSTVPLAGC